MSLNPLYNELCLSAQFAEEQVIFIFFIDKDCVQELWELNMPEPQSFMSSSSSSSSSSPTRNCCTPTDIETGTDTITAAAAQRIQQICFHAMKQLHSSVAPAFHVATIVCRFYDKPLPTEKQSLQEQLGTQKGCQKFFNIRRNKRRTVRFPWYGFFFLKTSVCLLLKTGFKAQQNQ